MYKNYSRVKTYSVFMPRGSLEDVAREFKSGIVVKKSVVKALREIKSITESVKGRSDDEEVSEKLRNVGLLLIAVPEPFQISSLAGATLCGASLILRNLENKTLGIKDVVRAYRKALLELKHVLKE
ncbi:MAG: hypothetical protein J7L12_02425 [Desulfurococcales archaeon]|nr:hypothetical protein [Desulfurococcales archaeon]